MEDEQKTVFVSAHPLPKVRQKWLHMETELISPQNSYIGHEGGI